MSRFGMITEDPFYDEDGVLIDEDADLKDIVDQWVRDSVAEKPQDDLSPFQTINS